MGAKQKKALKKNLKKVSSQLPVSSDRKDAADFLPLEGRPGRKLPEEKPLVNKAAVLYIGRIPHGFYEKEMHAFFSQFGTIRRLRIARNKKTGKSKHFGFIEFNDPEVRTLEEHKKLMEKILKHDQKRRKRIEAASIEYECPEIVGYVMPAPKKIKFDED